MYLEPGLVVPLTLAVRNRYWTTSSHSLVCHSGKAQLTRSCNQDDREVDAAVRIGNMKFFVETLIHSLLRLFLYLQARAIPQSPIPISIQTTVLFLDFPLISHPKDSTVHVLGDTPTTTGRSLTDDTKVPSGTNLGDSWRIMRTVSINYMYLLTVSGRNKIGR